MGKISIILKSICVSALLCLTAPSLAQNSVSPDAAPAQFIEDASEATDALVRQMSDDEIANELSNPVTTLRSIATDIQFRSFQGSLPDAGDKTSLIYLIKPSFPIPLSNGKNILLRATIPIYKDQPIWGLPTDHPLWVVDKDYAEFRIRQSPEITPSSGGFLPSHDHLADISFDIAYGGVNDKGFISMFGIVGVLPVSQDISASRDQFLLGPEVAFGKSADWGIIGAWATHLTTISGNSFVNTNETSVKVFFSYRLGNGWQFVANPEITYDWEAQSGEKLSLPIGGGISKTTRFGRMPLKLAFEIHNYIASADRFAPKWLLTFSITPVFGNP